jgi:hypothetical protein
MKFILFLLCSLIIIGCYEALDLDALCHPLNVDCAEKDFDEDGVINRLDDYPFDSTCAKNDINHCGSCVNACSLSEFCNIDRMCEKIKMEVCNGKDDDGNMLIDDILADIQIGVCGGSLKICNDGHEIEPNYQQISSYEVNEGLCDGLDNDCDGVVDETLSNVPLISNQLGICQGAFKECRGNMGYVDQYDQITGYLIDDTTCDGVDNDCDGKLDESVDLMLLEKQLGLCEGFKEVCALADGIFVDYQQSIDYQEIESKCDGLDNDCDGRVDEGIIDISLTTNQIGVCMNALKTCDGQNGLSDLYHLIPEYQDIDMKCDGLDNDCDGRVDEEIIGIPLNTNQRGVCMNSLKTCDGENGFIDHYETIVLYEHLETQCDQLDNDCDGRIDENIQDCCGNGVIENIEE